MSSGLRSTPLRALHERLGARMVDFAGFAMPVQYSSILDEHRAVREAAGLFDVSHMGQLHLRGREAIACAELLLTRPVASCATGRVRYGLLCNEAGGVVDDVTFYRLSDDELMLCVNASNIEKDRAWAARFVSRFDCALEDRSEATGLLALQGPLAPEILARCGAVAARDLPRYAFARLVVAGHPALVSRTGYTGSDGYEIYLAASVAAAVFEALLGEGAPQGLLPAGLGARDTLRLEAAMPLYGHELDDRTTPLEAGLERFVKLRHGGFIGSEALVAQRDAGIERRLIGFEVEGRGIARAGHEIRIGGASVGIVTSGAPSPTLGRSIGLAYLPARFTQPGTELEIVIRERAVAGRVVTTPFLQSPAPVAA